MVEAFAINHTTDHPEPGDMAELKLFAAGSTSYCNRQATILLEPLSEKVKLLPEGVVQTASEPSAQA